MSTPNTDYTAPEVSEYNLDPGASYVSPASDQDASGSGTLSASVVE